MKYTFRFLIIVICLSVSCCITSCATAKNLSADEIEDLFYNNRNSFSNASEVLHEILNDGESDITISNKDNCSYSTNERIKVREIGDLCFISVDHIYTDEAYTNMHDCVEQLFSSKSINGIYGNKSYIQFSIENYFGYESSIIYTVDKSKLSTAFSGIYVQEEITPNWYAIILRD